MKDAPLLIEGSNRFGPGDFAAACMNLRKGNIAINGAYNTLYEIAPLVHLNYDAISVPFMKALDDVPRPSIGGQSAT